MIGFIATIFIIWVVAGAVMFHELMIDNAFCFMPIYKVVIAFMFGGPITWVLSPFYLMYKWLSNNDNM